MYVQVLAQFHTGQGQRAYKVLLVILLDMGGAWFVLYVTHPGDFFLDAPKKSLLVRFGAGVLMTRAVHKQ